MNIKQELKQLADPKRAVGEKKYLKSPLKHYGVTVPMLRKLAKSWLAENKGRAIEQVVEESQRLWAGDYHEEKMIAIFLLVFRVNELTWTHYSVIEKMVRESTGWAQLDMIAAWLCGHLFTRYPHKMTSVMRQWVKDDNFWVRRAAILTLLSPVRQEPKHFVLFEELATPLLTEKEFFIRKAIGWVLREVAKVNPHIVFAYVKKYGSDMSGVTYREATRKLPLSVQAKLRQQYASN